MNKFLFFILTPVLLYGSNIGSGRTSIGAEWYTPSGTKTCVETFEITIIPDTAYWGDLVKIEIATTCDTITDIDSGRIGDSSIVFIDTTGDTISFIMPQVTAGMKTFILTTGSLTDTDSVYVVGSQYDTAQITADPENQNKLVGETANFSVTGTGTGTLSYQWMSDSGLGTGNYNDVVDETGSSIELTNVQLTSNGWLYSCRVCNDRGCDTSAEASLSVTGTYMVTMANDGNGTTSPAIDTTVVAGTPANISASVTTPNYHFAYWSYLVGAGAFGNASLATTTATPTEDATVLANFGPDTFYIDTTFTNCTLEFLSAADSIFAYGETCSLMVTVPEDTLVNWNGGDNIGSPTAIVYDTLVFTVTQNVSITATGRTWPQYTVDSTIVNGLPDSVVFDTYGTVDSSTVITVTLGTPTDSKWTVSGDTSAVGISELVFTAKANWTLTFTLNIAILPTPAIDSIRPNPNYRNDSCTIYLSGGSTSGTVTDLTADSVLTPKYYSDTQIDFYTSGWLRGWHAIEIENVYSLKDTAAVYIAVPRKAQ